MTQSNLSKTADSAKSKEFTNLMGRIKEMPDKIKKAPPKKFGKMGLGLVLGGVGFGWVIFPYILSFAVSKILNLNEGTEIRGIWTNIPQAFNFNVYVFNITNPDEVQNGATPVLSEVGPYVYREYKSKVELVDDVDNDEITYSNVNTWYFQEKETLPLTGEEMLTVPHLPLLSMLLVAESDFPAPILNLINVALPKVYGKIKSVFMTVKAKDLLFNGIPIDCTAKDIVPRTVCVAVKVNSRALVKNGRNKYLFSFFGAKNATAETVRVTVKRGVRDSSSIGKVVKLNGQPKNTVWRGGDCNTLYGTDSTIFPPFRNPDNMSIVAYSTQICSFITVVHLIARGLHDGQRFFRSITGMYEREGEYQGVHGLKYVVSFGDMSSNPRDSCYCPKEDVCFKKGTIDLNKCQGAPLVGTLPHFYQADESYLQGVIGLRPEKDKHELTFMLEPISGTPLVARVRLQFNVQIHPVRFVNLTHKLKPTMLPVFWIEENLDLGDVLMNFLSAKLLVNLKLVDVVKWTMIVAGSGLCVSGLVMHQKKKMDAKRQREDAVTPLDSNSSRERLVPSKNSGEILLNPSRLTGSTPSSRIYPAASALATLAPGRDPHVPLSPTPSPDVFNLERRLYDRLKMSEGTVVPPVEVTSRPMTEMRAKPGRRSDEKLSSHSAPETPRSTGSNEKK